MTVTTKPPTPKVGDWVKVTYLALGEDEPHLRVGERYQVTWIAPSDHGVVPPIMVRLHGGGEDCLVPDLFGGGDRWELT